MEKKFYVRQEQAHVGPLDKLTGVHSAVWKLRLIKFFETKEGAYQAYSKAPKLSYYRYESNAI